MRSVANNLRAAFLRRHGSSAVRRPVTCNSLVVLLAALAVGTSLSSCSATREQTKSPRGAIEQLLLSRSVERSLYDLRLPMLRGAPVVMEIEGLPPDLGFVKTLVAEQLGLQDAQIRENKAESKYVVKVVVHSIGTEQASSLFGMPEVQAGLFPIALPELALYKEQLQSGYARLSLVIYETSTGALKQSVSWRAGSAYYNFYTVLFWFTFPATDLILPPTPESGFDYGMRHSTGLLGEPDNGDDNGVNNPTR